MNFNTYKSKNNIDNIWLFLVSVNYIMYKNFAK